MPFQAIDSEALILLRVLSGDRADRYLAEITLPHLQSALRAPSPRLDDIRAELRDPYSCVRAFYSHYAFARRGKDRDELGQIASVALSRIASKETFAEVLSEPNGESIWQAFSEICVERKRKNPEQLNQGLIAGILELAQEIFRHDGVGSIAQWIERSVMATDRIEAPFLRLVDIRGVGPKTTSTFLRDVCFLLNLEDQLDPKDRLFIQPIDRWTRQVAEIVVPELRDHHAADWVIAGKLAKYTRRAGVSGIRFNMGTTYFGLREARDLARVRPALRELLSEHLATNDSLQPEGPPK